MAWVILPPEHEQRDAGTADRLETRRVHGVGGGFDRRGGDGVGVVAAPVVAGEDDGGVGPAAADDGWGALPDEVLAVVM